MSVVTAWLVLMTHPMLTLVAALDAAVDEVAGVDPIYMTVPDKKATLTGVARARARLEAVELKVLAAADDIAEATGDRSTATWLANQTREAHGTVRRKAALARALALDGRRPPTPSRPARSTSPRPG